MRRKVNNIIQYKDIFDPSPHCISWCPFKWLIECDNEPACVQTYMLISLVRYSLRHDMIHNLSVYDLYSNLSRGLPFLECFNTPEGINRIEEIRIE